ncbi:DUF6049 family protein [Auraticoccus monumenti]|uniref:DUF6049 family protein n=1 Tax=Auraticoccus monumenti TaxID=675864 RepID=UPI000B89139B|nr:DUF6049 family protein [Auraticoccus monumenti]
MSAPTRRRPRAGVAGALLLALLATLLCLVAVPGPPAAAVEPEPQDVSITLTEVSPATLDREDTLTVRGTATNLRQTPVVQPQLLLWRDQGTLYTDPAQLADLAAAPSTLPVGARVLVESAFTQDLPASLEPGQSVDFELSATVEELGLPPGDGAALVGVQAREAASTTVGRVRTLVPLVTEEHPPVPVATVVTLSAAPTRVAADLVADDSLGEQLGTGGRLAVLLDRAARPGVSWAVDPGLLLEVTDLADGYQVRAGPDETTPGAHAEAAARWLTAFDELPRERGFRLPWGDPDLLSVAGSDSEVLLGAVVAAQRSTELGAADGLPLLTATADGTLDAATLDLVDAMDPAAVLTGGADGSAVASRPDAPHVLDVDTAAFTPVLGPDPRTSPPQVVGHLTTRTLLASLAADAGGADPAPELRLVDTVEQAAADAATDDLAWQTRVGLPELLADPGTGWDGRLDPPPAGAPDQLDPAVLESAATLHEDLRAARELLSDPAQAADADRETSTAVSSWWRADRTSAGAREAWLAPRTHRLERLLSGEGMRLTVADNVAMSARSGQFPVSITNRLDRAVRVQVVFTTDNRARLDIPAITGLEVRPGQTVTATAAPRARANGSVKAVAQLATASGRPFGTPQEITIEASEIGRAGWVIVIGSGIVLVGGTVLRVRQVRRQQAAGTTTDGDGTTAPVHQEGTHR